MKGYNSLNESIALPPYDIMPPLIYGHDPHEPGRTFYTITGELSTFFHRVIFLY